MGLTDEEKKLMAKLQKKAEEPDAPPVGKSVNVIVDLKDKAQVAMAKKFGFLPDDDDEEEESEEEEEVDDKPKRRGYFPD